MSKINGMLKYTIKIYPTLITLLAISLSFSGHSRLDKAPPKKKKKYYSSLDVTEDKIPTIANDAFLLKSKVGKILDGVSYGRNWKDLELNTQVKNDQEIITGEDGFACLETARGHWILLLPLSRIKPETVDLNGMPHLNLTLYSGAAIVHAPIKTTSHVRVGDSTLKSTAGDFFAINDRKIKKYVHGVLTERSHLFEKKILKDKNIELTPREYTLSTELYKKQVRKMSWKLQKNTKKMIDYCRSEKPNLNTLRKNASRLYGLLNVGTTPEKPLSNLEYIPFYEFPKIFQKLNYTVGGSFISSSLSVEDTSSKNEISSLSSTSVGGFLSAHKIYNFQNTYAPLGINLGAQINYKDSSHVENLASGGRSFLFGLEFGPSYAVSAQSFLSAQLTYEQNDFVNTNLSQINNIIFETGSVLSSKLSFNSLYDLGVNNLDLQLYYQSNLSTPDFASLYSGYSALGTLLKYGKFSAQSSYLLNIKSISFFNVTDSRNDLQISIGLNRNIP